jgi:hypothetical protein
MPLSDREQQILSDIEARLREEDPKFAKTVGTTTVSSQARRSLKLALAGIIVGFVMILFFVLSIWYGVAGFALMLASAVYGGNMLKRLGQGQSTSGLGGQLRGGFDRYLQDKRDKRHTDDDANPA